MDLAIIQYYMGIRHFCRVSTIPSISYVRDFIEFFPIPPDIFVELPMTDLKILNDFNMLQIGMRVALT